MIEQSIKQCDISGKEFMLMNIAICDDEPLDLYELKKKAERFFKGKTANVSCFDSSEKFLGEMKKSPADIILLDIQMEGRDGMEAARMLRREGFSGDIVFVTVLPELVYDSFSVEAADYIVKPVEEQRLFSVLGRIIKRRKKNLLAVKSGGGEVLVPLEEITFIEVMDKEIILHKAEGRIAFRGSITETERKLGEEFFRCHRSFTVNLRHIERVGKCDVTLRGGEKIPLSRLRRQGLLAALGNYMGEFL